MPNEFKSATGELNQADSTLYAAPIGSTVVVIGLRIANKTVNSVDVNVYLHRAAEAPRSLLGVGTPIPSGSALEGVMGSKLVLQAEDELHGDADVDGAADFILSVMEIT